MSGKEIKSALQAAETTPPSLPESGELRQQFRQEPEDEQEHQEAGPDNSGCYPRSLHIIDFVLTNLFETAYLVPRICKLYVDDSADIMTEEDFEDTFSEGLAGRKIVRPTQFHDPQNDYYLEFEGLDDWSPFEVSFIAVDPDGNTLDRHDAHECLQAAISMFLYDMSLATTNTENIHVDTETGLIRCRDPLTLYKVVRDLILWRNQEAAEHEDETNMSADDPRFPIELRPVRLPRYGLDMNERGKDVDPERLIKIMQGAEYFHQEDEESPESMENSDSEPADKAYIALQNTPPFAYNTRADFYLAAYDIRERIEFQQTLVRLDEMEAIILQETRQHKTYRANTLLNLH